MNNDFNNNLNGNMDNQDNYNVTSDLGNMTTYGSQNETSNQSMNGVDNSINMTNEYNIGVENNSINTPNAFNANVETSFNSSINTVGEANNNVVSNNINNSFNASLTQNEVSVTPNVTETSYISNLSSVPNPESPKKKSPVVPIIIGVVIIALFVIGGIFGYKFFIMSNPVTIIEKSLVSLGEKMETAIKEYNLEMNEMLNSKIQNEVSFEFNEYSGNFMLKTDLKNKLIGFNVDATQNKENLMNVEAILSENAAYFKFLKDSTNNYMYEEEFSEIFNVIENVEEIDPIIVNSITHFGESFKEVFTKEDFAKDKVEVNLDGKNVNATRYTLDIKDSTINPLLENYKNKLISDDALISYLVDLVNDKNQDSIDKITKYDMIETIKNNIDDMKLNSKDNEEELKLSLFISGSKLVKIEFGIDDNNKFEIYFNEYIEFNFFAEGKKLLTAKMTENEFKMNFETPEDYVNVDFADGKYKIDINIDDESVIIDGTYNITDTSMELTFSTEVMGEKYNGKFAIKETISDDIKINVPSGALDLDDEVNQNILLEEIKEMPVYELIEPYMNNDYYYPESPGDTIDGDYYFDSNYDDDNDYYYDDSEWEF